MKYAPHIAALLLGGLFIMSASVVLLGMAPTPELPKDTAIASFMAAFGPTGYMTFVKVLELLGGLLVLLPRTRNVGLLILGPIIVNILAFHVFLTKGAGLTDPPILVIGVLSAFLLFTERKAWLGLVK